MLISIHIPKTAGTSFGHGLIARYGERMRWDPDDWPEAQGDPEALAREERHREQAALAAADYALNYDVIHGHFTARRYRDIFAAAPVVTFVRDPFQHAVSSFEHGLRDPFNGHPLHRAMLDGKLGIIEFVELVGNQQIMYLAGQPLEALAVAGVTERYQQSLALLEAVLGIAVPYVHTNANPAKAAAAYEIEPDLRRAIERHRAADIELYGRAVEKFEAACAARGL
jgi:Sulfotransferase family